MRVRERKSVFESHLNLLKSARMRIESASAMQRLRMGAGGILKDYVTKLPTLRIAIFKIYLRSLDPNYNLGG